MFWVGAAGFGREERALIDSCLHRTTGPVTWRLSSFADADAWLVNGKMCRLLANGSLRVSSGSLQEASLNLDIRASDRPAAFAQPLNDRTLDPLLTFNARSCDSIRAILAQFQSSLGFARAQFALGAEVVERGAVLRHALFHVLHRGELLAILDFWRGEAALSPRLDAAQIDHARWMRQPRAAWSLPTGFVQCTPAQLAWNYARRSERHLLPPRYRNRTIYYRHAPRVPLSWLRDSHLKILKELSSGKASLPELAERTGTLLPSLERDVACLFYARAVTTSKAKAAAAGALPFARRPILDAHGPAFAREAIDPTVPGQLLPGR